MKKNLMSVIILALLVVNLVLTAIMMFTVYPQSKAVNELVVKICHAINFDLNSGSSTGIGNVPVDKIEMYAVNQGADMTINLKKDDKNKQQYAVVGISLAVNKNSSYYEKNGVTPLSEKEALIKDAINNVIRTYTKDEFDEDPDGVKQEILTQIQNIFGADYVIGVSYTKNVTN